MVLITSKALKIGLKMHLERLKNQKFSTQGKGTPLPLDPNPHSLALWALPNTKYSIDVAHHNLLFRALYGFNYFKKVKSGLKYD